MEIRILHSTLHFRLTKTCLAFVLAMLSGDGHAQAPSRVVPQPRLSRAAITEWQDDVSAALQLLQQVFPNINSKSQIMIWDNQDWSHSSAGLTHFTIYACEPDSRSRTAAVQEDIFARYAIHCPDVTMYADFLMGGSQLGRVPAWIMIARPALDKNWSHISTILVAHPEWSKVQVEDALRKAGVKYGADSRNEVLGPIGDAVKKLEPFLGKLAIDSMDYSPPFVPLSEKEFNPPIWRVEAHPLGQDKKKPWTTYVLFFSAFDGALVGERK